MEIVEEMKEQTGMPYRIICEKLRLPLSSFNRWRFRIEKSEAVVKQPGPKKVEPFDPSALDGEIGLLDHGRVQSGYMGDTLFWGHR